MRHNNSVYSNVRQLPQTTHPEDALLVPYGTVLEHPCPMCGGAMVLRRSKYGPFYGCVNYPTCDCTHGAHKSTGLPLGVPADNDTRLARTAAHDIFDQLWKQGFMKRSQAYKWLAAVMGMDEVHIGGLNKKQCEDVVFFSEGKLAGYLKGLRR